MDNNLFFCPCCHNQYNLKEKYPIILTECGHQFCLECTSKKPGLGYQCRMCSKNSLKIALNEEIQRELLLPSRMAPCQLHNKTLDYVCRDCEGRICSDCFSSNHRSHYCKLYVDIFPKFEKKKAELKRFIKATTTRIDEIKALQIFYEKELTQYIDEIFKSFVQELEALRLEVKARLSENFKNLTFPDLFKVGEQKTDIKVHLETVKNDLQSYAAGNTPKAIFGMIEQNTEDEALLWSEKVNDQLITKELERIKLKIRLPEISNIIKIEISEPIEDVDCDRTLRKIEESLLYNQKYWTEVKRDDQKLAVLISALKFDKKKKSNEPEEKDLEKHFGDLDIEPIPSKKKSNSNTNSKGPVPQEKISPPQSQSIQKTVQKADKAVQESLRIPPEALEYVIYTDKKNYLVLKLCCPEYDNLQKFNTKIIEYDNKAYFDFEITVKKDPNKEDRKDRIFDTRLPLDFQFHTVKLKYQDFESIALDEAPNIENVDGCIVFSWTAKLVPINSTNQPDFL